MSEQWPKPEPPPPEVSACFARREGERLASFNDGTLLNIPPLLRAFRGEPLKSGVMSNVEGILGGQIILALGTGVAGMEVRDQLIVSAATIGLATLNGVTAGIKNASNKRRALRG
jgi:hypothetical protein